MTGGKSGFEGPAGVMARMNRDMEEAALGAVELDDGMEVVVLGPGPGVGLALLLERCVPTRVLAVEPSGAMGASARRRLRSQGPAAASVHLAAMTAADLGPAQGTFDLAIAVNSHQLWTPRAQSTTAVASVLRSGATLVSLTHAWAIDKQAPVAHWQGEVDRELCEAGFGLRTWSRAPYRSGDGVLVVATRL